MKKIFLFSIIIPSLLISCEKVIEIEVQSIEPKLVVDANFEVFSKQTPITANTVVKLRLSSDYFDTKIPTVANAKVFITNLSNQTIINFLDADSDGNYEPNSVFIPKSNINYELTIIYDNETYKGTAKKIKSPGYSSVIQGDKTLLSGEETELKINFKDEKNEENFYLFDFTDNKYLVIEDRFFNGTNYNFSFFYREDDIKLPSDVTLKMTGISKGYYTYFRVLSSQSGANGGGPFQSVPTALLGNIINTSKNSNYPLGYFHIAETDTFMISLKKKE